MTLKKTYEEVRIANCLAYSLAGVVRKNSYGNIYRFPQFAFDLTVKLTEIVFTNALIKQGLAKGAPTPQFMVTYVVT